MAQISVYLNDRAANANSTLWRKRLNNYLFRNDITHILLLAPSIDPKLEEILWYQKVADWKLIRWILPAYLDVCNQEILPARFELQKMEHYWKYLQTPMTLIQGNNDSLVPPANADYAEKMYPDKSKLKIIRGDMNHFIPWNEYELVQEELLGILKGD